MCICGVRIQCFQLELLKVFKIYTNYTCLSFKFYIPLAKTRALYYTYAKVCPGLEMAIRPLACVWTRISCVLLHLWRFPPAPFCGIYYIAFDDEPLSVPFSCVGSKSRMMPDFAHSSYNLRFVWCLFSLLAVPLQQLVRSSLYAPLHNFISFAEGNVSLSHKLRCLTHYC